MWRKILDYPFLICWILSLAFYFDTRGAGFVTDFLGWEQCFQRQSFWESVTAADRGIKSFYHVTHMQLWILTRFLGESAWGWWFIFSTLHAVNAELLRRFFAELCHFFPIKNQNWVIWGATLLFLLSPFQSEVLVWRASFHYLTGFCYQLLFLHFLFRYLKTAQKQWAVLANLLFFTSIFTLEYWLFTPFLGLFLLIFLFFAGKKIDFLIFKQSVLRFFGLPFLGVLGYFLSFKLNYGTWLAHYGGKSYASFFSLSTLSTFGKYVVKHLFLVRYWDKSIQIFDGLGSHSGFRACVGGAILLGFAGLFFLKRLSDSRRLVLLASVFGAVLLMPVLTWHFSVLGIGENDRYGYFSSGFLFFGFLLIFHRLPRWILGGGVFLLVWVNIFYLLETNRLWFLSSKSMLGLEKNFISKIEKNTDSTEILLLNVPESMRNLPMYRLYSYGSAFGDALRSRIGGTTDSTKKIYDVMRYVMTNGDNSVRVRVDSAQVIRVMFNQMGTWWVSPLWGESDYEETNFSVKNDNGAYILRLKPTARRRKILFQVGDQWREVDTLRAGDQW